MSLSLLKAGAVAATALMISATAASAAPAYLYGTIDYLTKLKANHSNSSPTIEWLHSGDDVIIVGAWGSWFKVKVPQAGPDPVGYVKKSAVDVNYGDDDDDSGPGVKACFNGPLGYFCINS
jgi:hypothetical protein